MCTSARTSGAYYLVLPRLHVLNNFPLVPGRPCDKSRCRICCVPEIDVIHHIRQHHSPFDAIPLGRPIISLDAKIMFLFYFWSFVGFVPTAHILSFLFSLLILLRSSPPKCTCDRLLHLSLTFSFYNRLLTITNARCPYTDAHPRVLPYYSSISFRFL